MAKIILSMNLGDIIQEQDFIIYRIPGGYIYKNTSIANVISPSLIYISLHDIKNDPDIGKYL